MHEIKTPTGETLQVHGYTDEQAKAAELKFKTRHEVAMAHCRSQGWPEDAEKLSMDQILEIRALPEWKGAK